MLLWKVVYRNFFSAHRWMRAGRPCWQKSWNSPISPHCAGQSRRAAPLGQFIRRKQTYFPLFALTPPERVRCVILGQDPYHEPEQAHGLRFSVRPGVPLPRSLRNIYKEREADLGLPPAQTGCLIPWARAGVLLINTVLTVDAGQANSHAKFGWQTFTDAVFRILWQLPQPVAFVLWGKQAQIKLERAIDAPAGGPRLVHTSAHPSPLSAKRGFSAAGLSARWTLFCGRTAQFPSVGRFEAQLHAIFM